MTLDPSALSAALKAVERTAAKVVKTSDELAAARAARDEALRAVVEAGVSKAQVGAVVRQHLAERGWEPEKIAAASLSEGTVWNAVRPRRGA